MSDEERYHSPAEIRHRIGTTGTFSLNNVSGDIHLRGADTDDVTVLARWSNGGGDRALPLVVRRAEGSLQIETDERDGRFSFGHHGSIEFDVSVPRGARVDVNAVSADVESDGLVGDHAYKTVSGDLVIERAGGRLSATTVSGDIQISAAHPLDVSLTTTSGDIEASAPTFQPVRIRTVSGDMTLHGGFAAAPQHTIESVSGDLDIESTTGLTVDTKRGLDFSKSGKRPLVTGDGRAQLRFRSLSGDIQLGRSRHVEPAPEPEAGIGDEPALNTDDSLEILRALERGEIDVDEASRRLEGAVSRG